MNAHTSCPKAKCPKCKKEGMYYPIGDKVYGLTCPFCGYEEVVPYKILWWADSPHPITGYPGSNQKVNGK